jgi:hypothetical protein
LFLTNGQYFVKFYPGDTDVEPRAYINRPPPPDEEEVLVLFRQLFGDELNPQPGSHYVMPGSVVDFMFVWDHPTDPASPEPSDN